LKSATNLFTFQASGRQYPSPIYSVEYSKALLSVAANIGSLYPALKYVPAAQFRHSVSFLYVLSAQMVQSMDETYGCSNPYGHSVQISKPAADEIYPMGQSVHFSEPD
jgi:hypothetical protein